MVIMGVVRYSFKSITLLLLGFFLPVLLAGGPVSALASPGAEVFQGFIQHISVQIGKDKQEFSVADTCTMWFYKQLGDEKPEASIDRIRFIPTQGQSSDLDCRALYPNGLLSAREAFGQTQQDLSLSLTFYQMALVGDGDDDQAYSPQEIQDVFEAFGVPFQGAQPTGHYLGNLNRLFDSIREGGEFQSLMNGMQVLLAKGYRLTGPDQAALNHELE